MKCSLKYLIHLGIMIFDRLTNQTEHNFISAFYQCVLNKSPPSLDNIPSCATLQEACSTIQKFSTLKELNDNLVAVVQSFHLSKSCQDMCDGVSSSIEQIFIFKCSSTNQPTAHPILPVSEEQLDIKQCSTCGDNSTISLNNQIHKQVFIHCPSCLIVRIRSI